MENQVAVVAIIVEDPAVAGKINDILHEYGNFIIGRMGLPYREKHVSIISIMLDAPTDKINALAGKLGRLDHVTARAVYTGMK
ncbi:MAG: iron-only hydrogenase system regulator [Lentisphaeria bacterium]|nr:iron-only hydrogenase system regulator [Lentisphaeria bacterium]